MSETILNLWSSGKIESRSLVGLLVATDAFTAALAISTWTASGLSWMSGSARFYLVWTSLLIIATAAALTAFVVHLPLRTELAFGAVLASNVLVGQLLFAWAVQYANTHLASFTVVSVFASFLVFTLHGVAGVLWYSRQNLLPTVFKDGVVAKPDPAKEVLPPA